MPASNVDTFTKYKVLPEYQPIIGAFRVLVREKFPQLKEEMRGGTEKYYGVPVYRLHRIIVTISPTKKGVTFAFANGGSFEDKYHMLEGFGKKSKNIRLSSVADFSVSKMSYYIRQAVALDR